jgi:hypothetical protein
MTSDATSKPSYRRVVAALAESEDRYRVLVCENDSSCDGGGVPHRDYCLMMRPKIVRRRGCAAVMPASSLLRIHRGRY